LIHILGNKTFSKVLVYQDLRKAGNEGNCSK
jgi:hypothetical protein